MYNFKNLKHYSPTPKNLKKKKCKGNKNKKYIQHPPTYRKKKM